MTFYHGTASTVEKSILKHGIRKSNGNGTEGIFVWVAPEFRDAVSYAHIRATEAKAPIGSTLEYLAKGPGLMTFRAYKVTKHSGRVDPTARPIVFAIDLPDSWVEESPIEPGEWRVSRKIPPSMLSLIRLPDVPHGNPIAALKGLQDARATMLRVICGRPQ